MSGVGVCAETCCWVFLNAESDYFSSWLCSLMLNPSSETLMPSVGFYCMVTEC